jgi:lipopolysaccharide transport system permease protein
MILQQQPIDQGISVPDLPETIISPPGRWATLGLGEIWDYRELLYFLIWRDIKVRYKQTALGAAWAVIQPFLTMIVFSVVFGWLAGIPSDGLPYPVFSYAALVPWTYFANALTHASNSVVDHERIISKVYFPRLLIPLAAVSAGLVDLVIACTILIGLMAWYDLTPTVAVWTLPLFVLMAAVTALSVSLWLGALNVRYRDVRTVMPFIVQFWLFVTPVVYSSSLVPAQWRPLYGLNPMTGVVEGFRWALLGQGQTPGAFLVVSALTIAVVLLGGVYYFRRMEETFVDVV